MTVFFLFSCSKDSVSASTDISAITGKWNVLNDSGFAGVGVNNHPVNHIGQSGDYFDFRTGGNGYIKEATLLNTLQYMITSDTTMTIGSFPGICHITNFTGHSVIILAPLAITPGGIFGRKVQLYR